MTRYPDPIPMAHPQMRARYQQVVEQDMNLIKNRSSFGPYVRIERNGYSPFGKKLQQEALEERNDYYRTR